MDKKCCRKVLLKRPRIVSLREQGARNEPSHELFSQIELGGEIAWLLALALAELQLLQALGELTSGCQSLSLSLFL